MVILSDRVNANGEEDKEDETNLATQDMSEQSKPITTPGSVEGRRLSHDQSDEPPTLEVGQGSVDEAIAAHNPTQPLQPEVLIKGASPASLDSHPSNVGEGKTSQSLFACPAEGNPSNVVVSMPGTFAKVNSGEDLDQGTRPGGRLLSYESLEAFSKSSRPTSVQGSLPGSSQAYSASSNGSSSDHTEEPSSLPNIITTSAPGTGAQPLTSTSPTSSNTSVRKTSGLRRGKWTVEEEAYVARVIQDFNSGFLDAPAGTTLRTFLSEKLQCDPMRITKKFTGDACIGKRVFHPAVRSPSNGTAIDKAQAELHGLERRWQRRLELQQRESAKKAAASAAAAAAATGRNFSVQTASVDGTASVGENRAKTKTDGPNMVTQTASWLDRAKSVLQDPSPASSMSQQSHSEDFAKSEIMSQMQEVQRLLHEGPTIQKSSADLPDMMDKARSKSGSSSPPVEPADKRLRTGAEDAEALVGFLRSVRASAASGQEF
jgi:hypothetical protein|mmetsp:Transcript_77958/g.208364  ORF Transcript_77958/g.208364 Transcript_77958/m.208364 type:complete len:488 (-) Transcript_77958:265-1728(-)